MKILFRILIYLSLIFLVVYLYKFNYLQVRDLDLEWTYLIPATLFLWAGFLMSTLSWWKALRIHKIFVSKKTALVSHGLSIFAKYIPGKVWVILGRASFVSLEEHSMRNASYISLKEQLIYVWLGLVIGIGPMLYYYPLNSFVLLVLVLLVFFSFFLYSRMFHQFTVKILGKIIRKKLDIPLVSFKEVVPLILYIFSYWVMWMVAFYFFILAFQVDFSMGVIFCWPLSISLGVLSLITPGGIGVREGIMTGFMVLTGMPLEIATTIAIISRLWFISGEVFIFFVSLALNKFSLKPIKS
jgi:uncharacterized membrane protein YbhN (UPF0104 family)